FFKSFGIRQGEFERYAIDPTTYLRTTPESDIKIRTLNPDKRANRRSGKEELSEEEKVKIAVDWVEKIWAMTEDRRVPFFEMGVDLVCHGFSYDETEEWLTYTAGDDRKLIKKIKGIMKSLKKEGERREAA